MITVRIQSGNLDQAMRALASLGTDASPVLRAMGTTLKSITEGNFNSVGARYRPAPWKAKRDGKASNLQASTTLAKSFTLEITPQTATLGNPTIYAAIHQFGGDIRPKPGNKLLRFKSGGRWWSKAKVTIPARPFVPIRDGALTPAAEDLMVRAATRAIQRLVSRPIA